MNFNDVSVSDILYPECHLDSPIVTGKIVQAIKYAEIPCNQVLTDNTLLNVINKRLSTGKLGMIGHKQRQYGQVLRQTYPDIEKYNHIPYPECNLELFRLEDSKVIAYAKELFDNANHAYDKIASRIVSLLDKAETDLIGLGSRSDYQTRQVYKNIESLSKIMKGSRWYNPFLFWFTIKTEMRGNTKDCSKTSKMNQPNVVQLTGKSLYVQINMNLVTILQWDTKQIFHLTPEIVLMMSDVLEGRLMIDVAMASDPKYAILYDRGHQLWDLIDNLFPEFGNNVYNIVSMLEPFALGMLQLHDHSDEIAGSFIHYCFTELKTELNNNGFNDLDDYYDLSNRIINIMNIPDIHLIAEFFSFFRTFGHPTLEAITAADKVRSHMKKPKSLDFLPIMKAHAIFCGIIINGYRDRHGGAWPPLTLPIHASTIIKRLMSSGESLTNEICVREWKSFVGLHFKCFMPLELDSDLSMYMKDKALSPIKEEWDTVYPRESLLYPVQSRSKSRRLVDVFINDENFDPYNILQYILSGEYIHDPEFNISYSLKEKETKQAGRLFAKMTYKMRACQVVAESLIANGIGKYFKENGMVKDEHELLKTLHQLSVSSVPKTERYNEGTWDHNPGHNKDKDVIIGQNSKVDHEVKDIINASNWDIIRRNIFKNLKKNVTPNPLLTMNHQVKSKMSHRVNTDNIQKSSKYKKDKTEFDIYNQPTTKSEEKYDTISSFLTTDLQKFCLNWRFESTAIFARRVDEIYGLPGFFNWLHSRLERCVLYVADPYCPPNHEKHIPLDSTDDSGLFIHNPMGGIEGYSQKLWTIITIPFLFLSGVETNIRIAAVVQGDNQSIAITHKVHPHLPYKEKKRESSRQAKLYFQRLRSNLAALGHNLKATETIISTHFFVYSKRIYYDGMVLSQALKTISRCVFWSETLVDETRSACSNISTSVAKSIENGLSKDVGYALNILKTLQQLHVSLKFSINETLTPDVTNPMLQNVSWMLSAALIPAPLGGFNYLNLSRIYVRNIGDPITASIADIKRMIKAKLLAESMLQKIMNQTPGDATFLDWASDPYSANLPSSQSITKTIKNVTARLVLSQSVNPILRGLFHNDFHQEDKKLAEFLMDRSIILPRAAHEILDNSITGAREEIAGMLDTTKGLIRTGLRKGGIQPRLVSRLSHHDYEQFRIFNNLMRNNIHSDLIRIGICSVELARALRNHMWMHLTKGRMIYGLEVPDPLESMRGLLIMGSENCFLCSTESSPYCWFFIPKHMDLDKVNRPCNSIRVPYIGSSTEERSEIKLGSVKSASRALKSAIRIATVYTWAYGDDDESWLEAWYLANQRTSIDLDILKAITPISTSNNLAHRLRDRSTQVKFTGSSLNRVSRYVTISNDMLEFKLNDTKIDTNLIFQQVMLLGLSAIEQRYRYQTTTGKDNIIYHLHVVPNCCVVEMAQIPPVPSLLDPPEYQEIVDNPLIYDKYPIIESEINKLTVQTWRSKDVEFANWTLSELHKCLAQTLASTIIDIITKTDNDILKQHMSLGTDDNINSLITEFLLVDVNLFITYLGQYCAIKWGFDIHYKRPKGKWQMIELLEDLLSNTSKHIFTVLDNALSHPRVFRKFWEAGLLSPTYGPYIYNQDFTQMSIELIVKSYTQYLTFWLEGRSLEYLMAEQNEEAVDMRYDILQARHLCILCDLYCNEYLPPKIMDLSPIQKISVLEEFIKDCQLKLDGVDSWNIRMLNIVVYPTSTTYLRRGVIKQIRIREHITGAFDQMEVDLLHSKYIEECAIDYVPPNACTCLKLCEVDKPHNSTLSVRINDTLPINGWESHKYRRVGINSTSGYKALELYTIIQRFYEIGSDRLFIGEGSGCMLTVYNALLGDAVNYYNSGITEYEVIGQRELRLYPSEACIADKNLSDNSKLLQTIKPLFNGRPETTWIGNSDCFIHILKSIKSHSIGLVHSDMESGVDKDDYEILTEHAHLLAISINVLKTSGILVSKINPSHDFKITNLLSMYNACFSDIRVAFPKYSNYNSTECYLICSMPKILTLTDPEKVFSYNYNKSELSDISIINFITTIKYRVHVAFEKNCTDNYYDDKIKGISKNLTDDDKTLLRCGLTLNGPHLCNKLFGYDVGSPVETLVEASKLLLNEALNIYDKNRLPSTFFEPYPVLESTRIKYYMHRLMRKITGYTLLTTSANNQTKVDQIIDNLRRKHIILDLTEYFKTTLIPDYYKRRILGNRFKLNWILELDTKEVKNWWKLLSYVPIYQLSHRSDNNNINILIDEAYNMEDKGSTDSEDEIYTKVPLLGKEHNDLSYLQSELGYDSKITYPEPEPTYFSILNE